MTKIEKSASSVPATLPVIAPVMKGKAAPHMDEVRRLLSGEGGTIAQVCVALGLSDKDARGVVDAIRRKEGYASLPLVARKFVYKGADGKGFKASAPAKA